MRVHWTLTLIWPETLMHSVSTTFIDSCALLLIWTCSIFSWEVMRVWLTLDDSDSCLARVGDRRWEFMKTLMGVSSHCIFWFLPLLLEKGCRRPGEIWAVGRKVSFYELKTRMAISKQQWKFLYTIMTDTFYNFQMFSACQCAPQCASEFLSST